MLGFCVDSKFYLALLASGRDVQLGLANSNTERFSEPRESPPARLVSPAI